MKRSLTLIGLLILLCGNVDAKKKFRPAIIVKQDGTQVECLAEYPDKVDAKAIKFKADRDSKTQKMESGDIKMIRFFLDDDKAVDLERLSVISWANMYRGKQKISKPIWLNVFMRGPVTLYLNVITTTSKTGTSTEYIYYCKRDNEEVASTIAVVYGGAVIKIGDPFPKIASNYFADSPSIAEKIKNKEKGYSSKEMEAIVGEYNSEKLAQQGK